MTETTYALEVVVLPVHDVDRSLEFYRDKVGFPLDVDYAPSADFRVIQLTPPGSSCSVQFGTGLTDAAAGSAPRMHLVVADIEQARDELTARGVDVGEIRHKTPLDTWAGALAPGVDAARRDYASFAEFADPDGNTWVLQERGHPSA
ncbi:VOC family protein [Kitasatospora sp. NPDC052896]|uniref:VOC family protein n=1 Tax=Kitasatospora sp. NPDC052896 TaxID=3364061 RepID=UPI0037C59FEF